MNTYNEIHEPDRVRRHTADTILNRIEEQIERRIRFYATQPEHIISRRIEELEQEWDMERTLGTNAATLALTSAVLGLAVNRKWLLLTCGVMGFLFQHAVSGWCPPVPLMRRLGVRTRSEIDREKFALKTLRGDFRNLPIPAEAPNGTAAREILQSVNS